MSYEVFNVLREMLAQGLVLLNIFEGDLTRAHVDRVNSSFLQIKPAAWQFKSRKGE